MERSRTMEIKEIGSNKKQLKKWDTGMDWSRTAKKQDTGMDRSRTIKKWDKGMNRSRTMKKLKIGNGTVLNNKNIENAEWNGPEQRNKWDSGMERSRTMKNRIREWIGPKQ